MIVYTEKYDPMEINSKHTVIKIITQKACMIQRTIKLIEFDKDHIRLECPISNSIIEVTGTEEELQWIHAYLTADHWYTNF